MNGFTVSLALVDYIPVIFFIIGFNKLAKCLSNKMNTASKILFYCGSLMVFFAGSIKATYKLFLGLKLGEFAWMSNQFFANQAFGFLFVAIGLTIFKVSNRKLLGLIPTMGLVGMMVLGLGVMDGVLVSFAKKLKSKSAIVCYILSFVFCLMMGYLSSKNFEQAYMNWIAQAINCVGQGLFCLASFKMEKAGLKELQ